MPKDIKSTERIDELFKKGLSEGLETREKEELLFLLQHVGVEMIRINLDDGEFVEIEPENGNVH